MPVIRIAKQGNYTVMSNRHLDDPSLSLKAIGLMSKMLRLPDEWDYSVAGLTKICKDGKAAIQSALGELEGAGYLRRAQTHKADGTFGAADYLLYETPEAAQTADADSAPFTDNRSTAAPFTDFPSTHNPPTENQPQINTNLASTNNPPITPRKRRGTECKKAPDWEPELFCRFWALYPRGEDKQGAIREWDKLQPDPVTINCMSSALHMQLQSEDWQRGIGIPYAVRWLRHRRWEDEQRETRRNPSQPQGVESPEVPVW